jgi:DNA-binding CsgD family transcriptional regulator
MKLTPRETEVCSMVKNGLTSKEIARNLNIALHTVEKHRRNARSKLALDNKSINLRTYLSSP